MDLNRLQDRKKYNQWAKRKKSYSFYNGDRKKSRRKITLVSGIGLAIVLLISGLLYNLLNTDKGIIYGDLMVVRQKDLGDHEFQFIEEDTPVSDIAKEYLSTMGIETKVAQLLITTPELLNGIGQVIQIGEASKKKLMQYPVGGLIFSGLNFETFEQVEKLINHTKLFTIYPTFLAMEETGTSKIVNTNHSVDQVGINLDCSNEQYLLVDGDGRISMDNLKIEQLYGRDPVDLLNNGAHMLDIKYSFVANFNKIVTAVKNGTISEEDLDLKVMKVLEYKLTYGIE